MFSTTLYFLGKYKFQQYDSEFMYVSSLIMFLMFAIGENLVSLIMVLKLWRVTCIEIYN